MVLKDNVVEIQETVAAWINSVRNQGSLQVDPNSLAVHLTNDVIQRYQGKLLGDNSDYPKNASALAAYVLCEGTSFPKVQSDEELAIVVALGYLLKNLETHHELYFDPRVSPANDADRALIELAKIKYEALKETLFQSHPQLRKIVRPLEGSVRYVFLDGNNQGSE